MPSARFPPPLHVLTNDAVIARPDFIAQAESLLSTIGPLGALHLRTRQLTGRDYTALVVRLTMVATARGALLIVNERVDVALAAGAHGVQLGRGGLSVNEVRLAAQSVAPTLHIGVSVHSAAECAQVHGADWLILGQMFQSASHPDSLWGEIALLDAAVHASHIPIVAVGGITPDRVASILRYGGVGVAVISGIWGKENPNFAATQYLSQYGHGSSRGEYFPHG